MSSPVRAAVVRVAAFLRLPPTLMVAALVRGGWPQMCGPTQRRRPNPLPPPPPPRHPAEPRGGGRRRSSPAAASPTSTRWPSAASPHGGPWGSRPDAGRSTRCSPRPRRRSGANRRHQRPGRSVRLTLRYSSAEYADIRAAAQGAGVTATSYAADAAIAAAQRRAGDVNGTDRQVVLELLATRAQLRRYGNNLNQAGPHPQRRRRPTRVAEERHRVDRPSRPASRPRCPRHARPGQQAAIAIPLSLRFERALPWRSDALSRQP